MQLDHRLSFGEHLKIAAAKAIQCGANLAWLMPNIGGPRGVDALQNHAIQRKLFSAQRLVALRIVSAYRTVSTSAVLFLASVPPIDLLAEERQETYQLRKELTCANLQEIARAKEAIC